MADAIVDLLAHHSYYLNLEVSVCLGLFFQSEYYSLNPSRGAAYCCCCCYSFENCLISGPSSSSSAAIVYYWSGTGHHDFRL